MDKFVRRCCGCREMKNKELLIRVVRTAAGEFFVDKSKKADGRGAYVCKNADCINKVVKTKALNRSFHGAVPGSIYGELEKNIEE